MEGSTASGGPRRVGSRICHADRKKKKPIQAFQIALLSWWLDPMIKTCCVPPPHISNEINKWAGSRETCYRADWKPLMDSGFKLSPLNIKTWRTQRFVSDTKLNQHRSRSVRADRTLDPSRSCKLQRSLAEETAEWPERLPSPACHLSHAPCSVCWEETRGTLDSRLGCSRRTIPALPGSAGSQAFYDNLAKCLYLP